MSMSAKEGREDERIRGEEAAVVPTTSNNNSTPDRVPEEYKDNDSAPALTAGMQMTPAPSESADLNGGIVSQLSIGGAERNATKTSDRDSTNIEASTPTAAASLEEQALDRSSSAGQQLSQQNWEGGTKLNKGATLAGAENQGTDDSAIAESSINSAAGGNDYIVETSPAWGNPTTAARTDLGPERNSRYVTTSNNTVTGENGFEKPMKKRGATRRSAPSTWQEQLRQKEREEQRLLKQVERLRKEAETLRRLEQVQQEAEMLMGSLGACPTPSGRNDSFFFQPLSSGADDDTGRAQRRPYPSPLDSSDCDDYSDYSSEQSILQEDIPHNALEYVSDRSISPRSRMRHKISSITKRRVPRTDDFARHDLDVESPSSKNKRGSSSRGRSLRTRRARRVSVSLRELASKIMVAVVTDLDDETLRHEDTEPILIVITLIKEAIFGILIAFAIVSLCLFLDHHFLLKLPTAHNFRRATAKLMTDQETLLNLEEDGLKVVDPSYYNSMVEEIDRAKNKTRSASDILRTRTDELEGMEAWRDQYQEESPKLYATLELDKFCEKCIWSRSQGITCLDRVNALMKAYHSSRNTAMVSAMKRPSCKRQTKEEKTAEEEKKKELEKELLDSWSEHRDDFCGDCNWAEEMSCQERVNFLHSRWEVPWNRAKAAAMVESKKCRYSNNQEEESKLRRFCPKCKWGKRLTCLQRVEYLMYTYKDPERKAKLSALKKPSCLSGEKSAD